MPSTPTFVVPLRDLVGGLTTDPRFVELKAKLLEPLREEAAAQLERSGPSGAEAA